MKKPHSSSFLAMEWNVFFSSSPCYILNISRPQNPLLSTPDLSSSFAALSLLCYFPLCMFPLSFLRRPPCLLMMVHLSASCVQSSSSVSAILNQIKSFLFQSTAWHSEAIFHVLFSSIIIGRCFQTITSLMFSANLGSGRIYICNVLRPHPAQA